MKTGLTIQQMAQELLRQSKAKQDYLVNTGSLSLSVTTDAPQLRVTENGLDKIAPLDIRQTAHRQLGTYLGIPQKYYELMRTDAPELLAYTPMIASQVDADRSVPKRNIPQRHFGRCAIPTDGASAAGCLPLFKSRRPNTRNGAWSWLCRRRSRMPFPK